MSQHEREPNRKGRGLRATAASQQTVRIWDKNGVIAASVQVGKFPPTDVTGIIKDGDMLVLSISHEARPAMLENGAPIWAVISLTLAGDTMEMAQMLERSQTIKFGWKRQGGGPGCHRQAPPAGHRRDVVARSCCSVESVDR
jgi:hypothetical protein